MPRPLSRATDGPQLLQVPPSPADPYDEGVEMTDGLRVRRVVAGIGAWALFAGSWVWVLRSQHHSASSDFLLLPGAVVVTLVLTVAWQRHNRALYRRKGARRAVVEVAEPWTHDRLGRRLQFRGDVRGAAEVVVHVDAHGTKTYQALP